MALKYKIKANFLISSQEFSTREHVLSLKKNAFYNCFLFSRISTKLFNYQKKEQFRSIFSENSVRKNRRDILVVFQTVFSCISDIVYKPRSVHDFRQIHKQYFCSMSTFCLVFNRPFIQVQHKILFKLELSLVY